MYEALIFEGGGIKGMCYIGALEELINNNAIDLNKIKYYGGTSAGSMVATLLASNHTISEICDIMYNTNWEKLKDSNFFFLRNLYRLLYKFGYNKGKSIETFIDKFLFKKFGIKNITFEQMYLHTQNHLKMVGTNITKGEIIYMDHIHTPGMSVAKGVQISSCVPFIFKPVSYNNNLYIDGGLIKNLDLDMFTEFEVHTLALEISDFKDINIKNLSTFGLKVFMLIYKEANRIKNDNEKYLKILSIPEDVLNPFDFKLSKSNLDYLKIVGKKSAKSIL